MRHRFSIVVLILGSVSMYVQLFLYIKLCLLDGAGKEVYLSHLEQLCVPHSTPTKASTYTYSMF